MTDNEKDQVQRTSSDTADEKAVEGPGLVAGVVAGEVDPHGATVVAAVGDETGVHT